MDNQTLEVKLTEFITKLNAMGCKFDDNNNLLHQEINEIKTIVNKTEHSNITLITKFKR